MALPKGILPVALAQQHYGKAAQQYEKAQGLLVHSYLHKLDTYVQQLRERGNQYEALPPPERAQFLSKLETVVAKFLLFFPEEVIEKAPEALVSGKIATVVHRARAARQSRGAEQKDEKPYRFERKEARALREKAGYSRPELAKELRISQGYITKLEDGEIKVPAQVKGEKMQRYLAWLQKHQAKE